MVSGEINHLQQLDTETLMNALQTAQKTPAIEGEYRTVDGDQTSNRLNHDPCLEIWNFSAGQGIRITHAQDIARTIQLERMPGIMTRRGVRRALPSRERRPAPATVGGSVHLATVFASISYSFYQRRRSMYSDCPVLGVLPVLFCAQGVFWYHCIVRWKIYFFEGCHVQRKDPWKREV